MASTRWKLRAPEAEGWQELVGEHGLHPLVARILARRGYDDLDEVDDFLHPSLRRMYDPGGMADMDRAVAEVVGALEEGASIAIHGDYDVDGLASTALLVEFFGELGVEVDYEIPHRIEDGYGLSRDRIESMAHDGCDLLITSDCGVTARDEIAAAREAGMQVVVIDHHTVPEDIPNATAILNPHRDDCEFPFTELAASGVAFNFAVAVRRALREQGYFTDGTQPNLKPLLELVALGTVADVVPLVDENRIFVSRGLDKMNERPRPGVRALLDVAEADGRVTTNTIGYKIAPRINAAGRIADASACVELLTTRDGRRARELAEELDRLNTERRDMQGRILDEALEQAATRDPAGDGIVVVDGEDWHRGVLGIVAGRLSDRFHRPAVVLDRGDELAKGSARSIEGVDIVELFGEVDELLEQFGGHAAAAGLSLAAEKVEKFRKEAGRALAGMIDERLPAPSLEVDECVRLGDLDRRFIEDLHRLRPFGSGNPEPILACQEVHAKRARIVGDDHLKGEFTDGTGELGGIGFSMGDQMEMLDETVAAAFVPRWSVFRGRGRLELHLRDLRVASNTLFDEESS
jgi:single-stranded-DNA-specific exonuclease